MAALLVRRAGMNVPVAAAGATGADAREVKSRWGGKGTWSRPERPRWRQFLMVQSWIARTSLVIQREQYLLTDHMITCGSRRTHGNVRHAHRAPASDDFDNALAAMPPWEA